MHSEATAGSQRNNGPPEAERDGARADWSSPPIPMSSHRGIYGRGCGVGRGDDGGGAGVLLGGGVERGAGVGRGEDGVGTGVMLGGDVGRDLGVGLDLGVGVTRGVVLGLTVAVAVAVGVGDTVGVGVGVPAGPYVKPTAACLAELKTQFWLLRTAVAANRPKPSPIAGPCQATLSYEGVRR